MQKRHVVVLGLRLGLFRNLINIDHESFCMLISDLYQYISEDMISIAGLMDLYIGLLYNHCRAYYIVGLSLCIGPNTVRPTYIFVIGLNRHSLNTTYIGSK
jgi:hypothetical protein